MFDLQSVLQSAVQSADSSADSDQTCTFQYTIPAGDHKKYGRHGRELPSGYGT